MKWSRAAEGPDSRSEGGDDRVEPCVTMEKAPFFV